MPLVPAAVGAEVVDELPVARTPLYVDARHLVARRGLGHAVYHMGRAADEKRPVIRLHIELEPDATLWRVEAVRERFHHHFARITGRDLPDHVRVDVHFGTPPSRDLISHSP